MSEAENQITVRVRLFGHYKDRVAANVLENGALVVSLPADGTTTIATLADILAREHVGLNDLLAKTRVAVGVEFANAKTILNHNDEVAFLPPMSGG